MSEHHHVRHRPPSCLVRPRELVLAIPQLRSNVNLARIVRAAGCSGIGRIIVQGRPRIDPRIARDSLEQIEFEYHRSLLPTLQRLKREGIPLVGLEQATGSVRLPEYPFPRQVVLVVGHERRGLEEQILSVLDHVVEIPVFGRPASFNVATATALALYEYCRQYPQG